METSSLTVPAQDPRRTSSARGSHGNAIFKLQLKGTDQQRHVMIRDMTLDPITRALLHVDFVRVLLDKKLRVEGAVEIVGDRPIGVKDEGGILNIVTHELEIECLPADIPASIKVDVSELQIHDSFRVSDLKLGDKIKVLEAPDRVIVHVGVPKAEEVGRRRRGRRAEGAAASSGRARGDQEGQEGERRAPTGGPAGRSREGQGREEGEEIGDGRSSSSWWDSATPATGTPGRGTTSASTSWRRSPRRPAGGPAAPRPARLPGAHGTGPGGGAPRPRRAPADLHEPLGRVGEGARAEVRRPARAPHRRLGRRGASRRVAPPPALRARRAGRRDSSPSSTASGRTRFPRLRLGVRGENFQPAEPIDDYVLSRFSKKERPVDRRGDRGRLRRPRGLRDPRGSTPP